MNVSLEQASETAQRDAFVGRLLESFLGVLDVATIYLGERLGLYRALAEVGPSTSTELAARTGLHERYVREWLEQQTMSKIVQLERSDPDPQARRYQLPAAHQEVLLDSESMNFLGPYPAQLLASVAPIAQLMQAFRDGGGVPYEAYGRDCRDGIAAGNRVQFINLLGSHWFPSISELDQRLRSKPAARVADIGCGYGWSAISIARAYPLVHVDAFDLDQASIESASQNARDAGVEDRVVFSLADAADIDRDAQYDVVVAFETIHDMARPVAALQTMRRLVRPNGFVIVADENVGESFDPAAGDIERLYYGFSVLHCLPAGMAAQPSAATGTVMRPATLRAYAQEAGFRDLEVLPIEHDFWRFYRLLG